MEGMMVQQHREDADHINALLCDELLAEVLCRVEGRRSATLVCKRWMILEGRLRSKLWLRLANASGSSRGDGCAPIRSLLQRRYGSLTTLHVDGDIREEESEQLLLCIAACCSSLRELRFTVAPPSGAALAALALGCRQLRSLDVLLPQCKALPVLASFSNTLKELSFSSCITGDASDLLGVPHALLPLEELRLEGISARNTGLGWLWRSCSRITRLDLFGCQGIGCIDAAPLAACFPTIQELRLRRCRSVANAVLATAAAACRSLRSLAFMDGGDMQALHRLLSTAPGLQSLQLRLPLDLFNEDLAAIAGACSDSLRSLRLYSCWMATGAGFKLLGSMLQGSLLLEELALVRCRAIVQDAGTLAVLGQHLRALKRLDLSENDHLADREVAALLQASDHLGGHHQHQQTGQQAEQTEQQKQEQEQEQQQQGSAAATRRTTRRGCMLLQLRLRRCRKLTDKTLECIALRCGVLAELVVSSCDGVTAAGVSSLLEEKRGCPSLSCLWVERDKVSEQAARLARVRGVALPGVEPNPSDY